MINFTFVIIAIVIDVFTFRRINAIAIEHLYIKNNNW